MKLVLQKHITSASDLNKETENILNKFDLYLLFLTRQRKKMTAQENMVYSFSVSIDNKLNFTINIFF